MLDEVHQGIWKSLSLATHHTHVQLLRSCCSKGVKMGAMSHVKYKGRLGGWRSDLIHRMVARNVGVRAPGMCQTKKPR